MKIQTDNKFMEFTPETNQDWFELGRISSNLNYDPIRNTSHLEPVVENISIPLSDIFNILANGKIIKEEDI